MLRLPSSSNEICYNFANLYHHKSQEFYALSYLKAWNNANLLDLSCFLLNEIPVRENFDIALDVFIVFQVSDNKYQSR